MSTQPASFFQRQEAAKARTRFLVVYFALAVVGVIVSVYFVAWFLIGFENQKTQQLFNPELAAYVVPAVLGVIALGSIYKMIELSQGGQVVASALGGRPIDAHTQQPDERRLLNVVEEMAIASGSPVPQVFLLDQEEGINAFAAGNTKGDAVVGVTKGCMQTLRRDELQGVIGHEFSHILNGDMRLNVKLIGLLNGILCIAILGRLIFEIGARGALFSGGSRSRDSKNALPLIFFACGAALWLIGSIGVLFGKLIRASVSRQREFLADASSVQFTRNPAGICGALRKIGQSTSKLASAHAPEASHMFFGNALSSAWFGLLATHPPIQERISAIDPSFLEGLPTKKSTQTPSRPAPVDDIFASRFDAGASPAAPSILDRIPKFARQASGELHSAAALVLALLLSDDSAIRDGQVTFVEPSLKEETLRLFARRADIPHGLRVAVIDLCVPTLRQLSPQQFRSYDSTIKKIVEADRQIDLFEFVLQKIVSRHLGDHFSNSTGPKIQIRKLEDLAGAASVLIAGLSVVSGSDDSSRKASVAAGAAALGIQLPPTGDVGLAEVDAALNRVATASQELRQRVLDACVQTVLRDREVLPQEADLLRAISDALDCPAPSFLSRAG